MADSPQYGARVPERLKNPLAQWTEAFGAHSRQLRVAIPGIVQSFDATKQTVTVLPAVRELPRIGGQPTVKDVPLLVDVPVLLPRGGGFTLTLPIVKGDECLVVFADSCIDAWYQSGGVTNPFEQRRHSLADGFALLGPWNQQRLLSNYSASTCQLRNDAGTVIVELTANGVNITTAQNVVVNASGNANVQASGTATVQGATVNVTGSSQVNISGGGHTSIEGKDWLTHKHSGVQTGGGVSGPVL